MKYNRTWGCTGDLSLAANAGTCRIQLIKDLTELLNDIASDQESAKLLRIQAAITVITDNYTQFAAYGHNSFYRLLLIKLAKSATITYTALSGGNTHLEDCMDQLIDNEFSFKVLRQATKPTSVVYDSTTTKYKAHFHLNTNYVLKKALFKMGEGGISDEHIAEHDSDNNRIVLVMLIYNPGPSTSATTSGYRGVFSTQIETKNRQNINVGL